MSKDDSEVVRLVYNHFMDTEEMDWSAIDDSLEYFGWLNDKEIIAECMVKMKAHSKGVRCKMDHEIEFCLAPKVLNAAQAIIDLYKETRYLPPKNKYILTYYLGLSELGIIFSDTGL